MKKSLKMLSAASALALLMSGMPIYANAADSPKVRVIVENGNLSKESGAGWDGILFDSEVEIGDGDNALTAFVKAVEENGCTQQGAEFGFVSEINGLGSEQGGAWMATLDDWFTDEGLSAYSVENGKLSDGDEICFMYTMNWGADLGYDWMSTNTTLTGISFNAGTLEPEFSPDITEYTLELHENQVMVVPTASSKSFPVKMYKNEYTADQVGTDFNKNTEIDVSDGDTIIIGVANSHWMSYIPDGVTETVYKIAINVENKIPSEPTESEISIEPTENEISEPAEDKITVEELREKYPEQQAVYGNEWGMITLSKFQLVSDEMKAGYAKSVKEYLDSIGTAKISNTRSTAVSGVVIALSNIGENAGDFYGYNLLEPLADMDYVTNQGINGAVYALMALDTADYAIPQTADGVNQTTREKLVAEILNAQGEDGGWTFDVGNKSDADMTGMALQALAPYKDDEQVKPAIEKALTFLSESQGENGGFVSYGSQDSESCSQVIAGLTMLDIDVLHDERFIKNGSSVYDMLMKYYREDGTFAHYEDGEGNAISTSQAYYAVSVMYESRYDLEEETSKEPLEEVSLEPSKEHSVEPSVSQTSVDENADDNINSHVNSNINNTVSTGDTQNIVLMLGAGMISASVIFVLVKRKKEN